MDRERGREPGKGGGAEERGRWEGWREISRKKNFTRFQYCYSFGLKNSAAFRIPVEWKRVTESEKKKIDRRGYYSTVRFMF